MLIYILRKCSLKKLKSDSPLPKIKNIICVIESPLKIMKNAFYFILKALFILKIFKFLSWLVGHVEETAWLERLISKFMTSQPGKQTIIIHLFPGFELAYCDLGNTIDC